MSAEMQTEESTQQVRSKTPELLAKQRIQARIFRAEEASCPRSSTTMPESEARPLAENELVRLGGSVRDNIRFGTNTG